MATEGKRSPKDPTDETTREQKPAAPQKPQAEGSAVAAGDGSVGVAVDQRQNRYSDFQE